MRNEHMIQLRRLMSEHNIDAVIIPGTDPHGSEYIAEHWQERRFISGFTGSAGTVVFTINKAALWTDSRYFIQADQQLEGSGIELMRDGVLGTPSIPEWLINNLEKGMVVSINPSMFSINHLKQLENTLASKEIGRAHV